MGHEGSIETVNDNDEEKMRPPNRNFFQRELSRINAEIDILQGQAKTLLNKDGRKGSITEARLEKEKIRMQRSQLAGQADKVKKEIVLLRKQRETLKTSRLEIEKECRVRSHDKLINYLKSCEDRYNLKNLTRKEEQLLVEEMNDLKKNKRKLEKLTEITKSLSTTDDKINGLAESNRETFREIFRLKAEQHAKSAEQRELTENWVHIRDNLDGLHHEKRELIANYNENRESYAEWIKKHRKKALSSNSSYPATFPNARQRTTSFMEEDELEPFYEQKRDCQRLINYLQRLNAQIENADASVSFDQEATLQQSNESDTDSADDFPESFARIHIVNKKPDGLRKAEVSVKQRKQLSKKTKPTQPISHVFEIYNLFGNVQVTVPANYQDVPRALEEVKEKLSFYNRQTNVIDWYQEYKDFEAILQPMSRSVSEYTYDSACIDSETASLASSRLYPSSPGERISSFHHDEGISSKDSNF